jgi:hypothetical protein
VAEKRSPWPPNGIIPVTGTKRRLPLVALADSDTVINIPKVEFREYFNPA